MSKKNGRNGELEVRIPIGDWEEEALRTEVLPTSETEAVDAVKGGVNGMQVARGLVVARERGDAPEDILKPSKVLLNVGAWRDVVAMMKKRWLAVQAENGTEYKTPGNIGMGKGGGGGTSYVSTNTPEGTRRTNKYLNKTIPGFIWNMLKNLKMNGEDVEMAAELLKARIDSFVERLTDPNFDPEQPNDYEQAESMM